MTESDDSRHIEQLIEKIVFDKEELETLKIAIKNFTEGKTSAKELKVLLLQCRGRMMEDITDFFLLFAEKRIKDQLQTEKSKSRSISTTKIESTLREEIKEKNELLEIVARRVNRLVSRLNTNGSREDQTQTQNSTDEVKEEIERCLTQIGAKEWIDMCFYDDTQFFVKLNPMLEELYEERFGKSKKNSKDANEGKLIMANKMVKLGFPEEIEDIVINYVSIRNNFEHSMIGLTPSNLELAREVFVKVFVYLIIDSFKSKFLLENREAIHSNLKEIFSKRLTGNPKFRKEIVERLKIVFYS